MIGRAAASCAPSSARTSDGRRSDTRCCWPSSRSGTPGRPCRPGAWRSATSCCRSTRRPASAGCCSAPSSPHTSTASTTSCVPDVHRLIDQVERGERIVQPRLRHRFQVDRHGLAAQPAPPDRRGRRHRVRLRHDRQRSRPGARRDLRRRAARAPSPPARSRRCCSKATRWRGPIGPALIAYLAGSQTHDARRRSPTRGRGRSTVLGFAGRHGERPTKREVTDAATAPGCATSTPTTAATEHDAGKAILDLDERPPDPDRATTSLTGDRGPTTLLLYPGRRHPIAISTSPACAIERALAPVALRPRRLPVPQGGPQGARPRRRC